MFTPRIIAAAALLASLVPAAVMAAPAETNGNTLVRQVHVQTDDLDLATAAGQRTLQARIRHASSQVCGTADLNNSDEFREMTRCRKAALSDAKPQIDTAMARAKPRYATATPNANTASGS